jgi:hypothetical protein
VSEISLLRFIFFAPCVFCGLRLKFLRRARQFGEWS